MDDQPLLLPTVAAATTTTVKLTSAAAITMLSDDSHDTTTTASSCSIVTRFLIVLLIAALASWADFEASKGFEVAVLNNATGTGAGGRFQLLFQSDDKALRQLLKASEFVESFLYPNKEYPKKAIRRVIFRLVEENAMTHLRLKVETAPQGEVTIWGSSAVMEEAYPDAAMASLMQQGIARVWLWDGQQLAPEPLLAAMADCIGMLAGWSAWDPKKVSIESGELCWLTTVEEEEDRGRHLYVASFLRYCEGVRPGFLARLNRAMQKGWHVGMVDEALGLPTTQLCAHFRSASLRLPVQPWPVYQLEQWLRMDM